MTQSIHHCPLCQGEISGRKSELLRTVVLQMQAIDAEKLAMEKTSNTDLSPQPKASLQVKLEPSANDRPQPEPSIPTSSANPGTRIPFSPLNSEKNQHNEKPAEEEKEQYFCPAPGCVNVYKKFGVSNNQTCTREAPHYD